MLKTLLWWELLRVRRVKRVLVLVGLMATSICVGLVSGPWSVSSTLLLANSGFVISLVFQSNAARTQPANSAGDTRYLLTRAVRRTDMLLARWLTALLGFAIVLVVGLALRLTMDADLARVSGFKQVSELEAAVGRPIRFEFNSERDDYDLKKKYERYRELEWSSQPIPFQHMYEQEFYEQWKAGRDKEPERLNVHLPGMWWLAGAVLFLLFAIGCFALSIPDRLRARQGLGDPMTYVKLGPWLATVGFMLLAGRSNHDLLLWAYQHAAVVLLPPLALSLVYAAIAWRAWQRDDMVL